MKQYSWTLPILSLGMTAALISCSSEEETPATENNVIRIEAVHPAQATRVNSTGFDQGDEIGVYVVSGGEALQPFGNNVNNGKFSYDGKQWNPQRTYYWNEGKQDVYAYYPYDAGTDDVTDYKFTVRTDQSTTEGYGKSDFLRAKTADVAASASPVTLKFDHLLSRAIVQIEKGEDFEGELPDNLEVSLHNTITTASVDLASGSASKDGRAPAQTIRMQKLSKSQFVAVVVPQRIDSRRPLVEVMSGNVSYLMEGTISFREGWQHTITITLSANPQQSEIEIGGGIGTWN